MIDASSIPSSTTTPTTAPPAGRDSVATAVPTSHLPPPAPASPTAISTALLVSSFSKLFPILLVIWGPGGTSNIPESGSHEVSSSSSAMPPDSVPASATNNMVMSAGWWLSPSSSFFFQDLVTSLISSLVSRTTSSYLGNCLEVLVSLLSLGAADTHLVLLNNVEALYILLGCGYFRAATLAVSGQIVRWIVQKVVLGTVLVDTKC